MQHYRIDEILMEQRRRTLELVSPHVIEARLAHSEQAGVRRRVAKALVRLGMTLDREAGTSAVLAR